MSFREVLRVLRRWRWVVVPVLLLALGAGGALYRIEPPSFSQSESYLLLYPVQSGAEAGNPLLQLGNGVGLAASVLATKVSAGDTAARLTAGTPGLTYTVAPDGASNAPILVVTAEGATRAAVRGALVSLGGELVSQLADLQKATGAPKGTWVTITQLTRDPVAAPSHKTGIRNGAGALAAVLLVGLLVVAALERGSRRRRARAAATARTASLPPVPVADPEASAGADVLRPVVVGASTAAERVAVSSGER